MMIIVYILKNVFIDNVIELIAVVHHKGQKDTYKQARSQK